METLPLTIYDTYGINFLLIIDFFLEFLMVNKGRRVMEIFFKRA